MPLVRDVDVRTHTAHGFTFRPRATPSLGSAQVAVWSIDAPPHTGGLEHTTSYDEVFVALSGALDVVINGEEVHLGAGDTLAVPAGTPFSLHNRSGEPASLLACTTAGMQAVVNGKVIDPPWTL